MKIRKAKKKDISACISIAVGAFNFSRNFMKKEFERKINDKNYSVIVAVENDEIIGYGYFQYREWNNTTYLESLAVKEGFRNKKIGTKLLEQVIEQSKTFGARRIFVDMDSDNKKVINFYQKNNFVKAGTMKDFSKEGKTAVILSMALK